MGYTLDSRTTPDGVTILLIEVERGDGYGRIITSGRGDHNHIQIGEVVENINGANSFLPRRVTDVKITTESLRAIAELIESLEGN